LQKAAGVTAAFLFALATPLRGAGRQRKTRFGELFLFQRHAFRAPPAIQEYSTEKSSAMNRSTCA
jgi:hypothetical protein